MEQEAALSVNLLSVVTEQNNKITELSINHAKLDIKVENIQNSTARIETKLDKFIDAIDRKVESTSNSIVAAEQRCEDKFAPKLAWDILKWSGATIMGALIITLVRYLFFKNG